MKVSATAAMFAVRMTGGGCAFRNPWKKCGAGAAVSMTRRVDTARPSRRGRTVRRARYRRGGARPSDDVYASARSLLRPRIIVLLFRVFIIYGIFMIYLSHILSVNAPAAVFNILSHTPTPVIPFNYYWLSDCGGCLIMKRTTFEKTTTICLSNTFVQIFYVFKLFYVWSYNWRANYKP